MKRVSENAETALVSPKCIKLNREELESADTATLIEKLVSLTDQLNEGNQMVRMWKTRLALARLQVLQINKELKDIFKERNDAYYSGTGANPAERDQLLDLLFYETYISMKERIGRREKEITELRDAVKALEKYAQEISERDAKIAELEKELYQYRRYVIEQDASEHTELD
ncbi:hypothetical protein KIN20_026436 [Parelaphostrongylus tenuis]|uniref:Uncharacterized protein n=1 Tax=Parelaphostrongylus tenuis TaxID=148309 RepID=A0AAD5QY25_PARTN|nr:hypothetical protein KIN20_026436 [Parelaphostrongylus tenuis]